MFPQFQKLSFFQVSIVVIATAFVGLSFDGKSTAEAQSCDLGEFEVRVFSNPNLKGQPMEINCEAPGFQYKIDKHWKKSGPRVVTGISSGGGADCPKCDSVNEPTYKVLSDNFSVLWNGKFDFDSGRYQVTTTSDDGIRVWIGNDLIIDDWNTHGPKTHRKIIRVQSGEREVHVEYFERGGGALVQVDWQRVRGQR